MTDGDSIAIVGCAYRLPGGIRSDADFLAPAAGFESCRSSRCHGRLDASGSFFVISM